MYNNKKYYKLYTKDNLIRDKVLPNIAKKETVLKICLHLSWRRANIRFQLYLGLNLN